MCLLYERQLYDLLIWCRYSASTEMPGSARTPIHIRYDPVPITQVVLYQRYVSLTGVGAFCSGMVRPSYLLENTSQLMSHRSRTGKKGPYAAYYVHFQPGSCFVGTCLYSPSCRGRVSTVFPFGAIMVQTSRCCRRCSESWDSTLAPWQLAHCPVDPTLQYTKDSLTVSRDVGCGLWMPDADKLAVLREEIDQHSDRLKAVLVRPDMRREIFDGVPDDTDAAVRAFVSQNKESALKVRPKVSCSPVCCKRILIIAAIRSSP